MAHEVETSRTLTAAERAEIAAASAALPHSRGEYRFGTSAVDAEESYDFEVGAGTAMRRYIVGYDLRDHRGSPEVEATLRFLVRLRKLFTSVTGFDPRVVLDRFLEAQRTGEVRMKPPNKRMQLTKPAQAMELRS